MVIEDVIAVDTGVGRAYRRAINERYEASPMFRNMLHQLNLFWAIPALCVGAGVTAAVVDDRVPQTVAYGIGMLMVASSDWKARSLGGRMGCSSTLGGHMGVDHDTMGADCVEKRKKCVV